MCSPDIDHQHLCLAVQNETNFMPSAAGNGKGEMSIFTLGMFEELDYMHVCSVHLSPCKKER